jgi:hypothetical protein
MKEINKPKADFITAIVLMTFSAGIIVISYQMPTFEDVGSSPFMAPGIVPGILGIVLFIFSAILLFQSIAKQGYQFNLKDVGIKGFFSEKRNRMMLFTLIINSVYALGLIGNISYPIATSLYVFVFVILFKYQRSQKLLEQKKLLITSFLQAIIVSAAVTLVFRYLFLVDLP